MSLLISSCTCFDVAYKASPVHTHVQSYTLFTRSFLKRFRTGLAVQ